MQHLPVARVSSNGMLLSYEEAHDPKQPLIQIILVNPEQKNSKWRLEQACCQLTTNVLPGRNCALSTNSGALVTSSGKPAVTNCDTRCWTSGIDS
jgi:hypothetical protein